MSADMAEQEASGENKQVKEEVPIINLIVKDQQGSEVHFKVKTHTKLEKVSVAMIVMCQTLLIPHEAEAWTAL
jgi:hypothetical protein